jgi:anti-repressor protein
MNSLKIFSHDVFGQLPVIVIEGTEWFGATESAKALSFSNPYTALGNHVEEDDLTDQEVIDSLGRKQVKKFINESGLYSLIFGAAKQGNNLEIKEKAKQYKRWVTSEVLPSIRKHGAYMTPQTIEQAITSPDFLIQLANKIKDEQERNKLLELKIELDKPKVHFAESVEISKDSILVADLAKLLRQKGIEIGEIRLYKWLRDEGYLIKSGTEYNKPTQRSMEMGLFEIKTGYRSGSDGTAKLTYTSKVTGKGQIYFINKFLKAA